MLRALETLRGSLQDDDRGRHDRPVFHVAPGTRIADMYQAGGCLVSIIDFSTLSSALMVWLLRRAARTFVVEGVRRVTLRRFATNTWAGMASPCPSTRKQVFAQPEDENHV